MFTTFLLTQNRRFKNLEKPSESEVLDAVKTLLRWTGDNPDRDGLKDNSKRVLLMVNGLKAMKKTQQNF